MEPGLLSILIPAIRTNRWVALYDSIAKSMHSNALWLKKLDGSKERIAESDRSFDWAWELIFVSPFDLPEELKNKPNIKLIKDLGSPTRCAQIGSFECSGNLLLYLVDDAILNQGALDKCVTQFYAQCEPRDERKWSGGQDILNCRYREGVSFTGIELPLEYWNAKHHDELKALQGIPDNFKISLHPMMRTQFFRELGGFDCRYEYMHATHDLVFRAQALGGIVHDSMVELSSCDHMPGHMGDHGAIHDSQTGHDLQLFRTVYAQPHDIAARAQIDINNWTSSPAIWKRRFKGSIPREYKDLIS